MEENQVRSRSEKRYKKKRLRKGRVILFSIFIVLIAIIAYSIHQYRTGLELAGEENKEEIEFTPDEPKEKIENYLIIGVDSRGEEKSRSDTMMVLSWNKETNDLKLVSFMRDIYADIPGYDRWKLNTAYYLGGVQLLKDTLNHMFEIPIHHYMVIDFKSFEAMIDILAPNGIEIEVEKDMSAYIGVSLTKGLQRLDGKELLGYARFRHDAEGDFGRVERQQKVIEALKDELLKPKNVKNLPKLIGAAQGYIITDMSSVEELKTALSIAKGGSPSIEKMTIPVEGTYRFNSYQHAGSVIEIDLEANKKKLHEFLKIGE
ncbi:LCP family protein [Ureibacillus sp. FSL K6-2830]|uniref:LCP family protein n=1 Tax=Ureibacillus sp. FSL K6-2830 TaxID=2954610 RepID=UPI0030F781B5